MGKNSPELIQVLNELEALSMAFRKLGEPSIQLTMAKDLGIAHTRINEWINRRINPNLSHFFSIREWLDRRIISLTAKQKRAWLLTLTEVTRSRNAFYSK
jgi:hypothetical protein